MPQYAMNKLCILSFLLILPALGRASDLNPIDHFAKTGVRPTRALDLWDASAADPKLYKQVFLKSQAPALSELRGRAFKGVITYLHNGALGKLILDGVVTERFGDFLSGRHYLRPYLFEDRFFAQDDAQGRSGVNFLPSVGHENLPMKLELGPSFLDPAGESVKIDYDLPENSSFTRPTIDELRRIPGSDLYIGQSFMRLKHLKSLPVLWFFFKPDRPYP